MRDKCHALSSLLIASLLTSVSVGTTGSSEKPDPADSTLAGIRNCMAQYPAPWPDQWNQEYVETVRRAITARRDTPHYAERLEILREGFAPYWEGFKKTQERSLFEVWRAQIRWYVEHLMRTQFPSEEARQKLRDQYKDLSNHAADSLLTQFPFLDPNTVQAAKIDHLSQCYRKIEAPLLPIYRCLLSEAQIEQMKERWHDARYTRVDLWRRSVGGSTPPADKGTTPPSNPERDYQLTKKCLSRLQAQVWATVAAPPDYYRSAVGNRSKAVSRFRRSKRKARSDQRRLEKERSGQLPQVEYMSFLLSAVLETTRCLDGTGPAKELQQTPPER